MTHSIRGTSCWDTLSYSLILLATNQVALPETRIALVIGNGAYSDAPLKNPENDAEDIAALLGDLRFDVTRYKAVSVVQVLEACRNNPMARSFRSSVRSLAPKYM